MRPLSKCTSFGLSYVAIGVVVFLIALIWKNPTEAAGIGMMAFGTFAMFTSWDEVAKLDKTK